MPTLTLEHPDVRVFLKPAGSDRHEVHVEPKGDIVVPTREWTTAYPPELVEQILRLKGRHVGDELRRAEDPRYVEHDFRWDILSYVSPEEFAGKRVLDFGCGSGSSTFVLARLLPDSTELVGVELIGEYVELARARARFHQVEDRTSFHISPDPTHLPVGIGTFDYVVLSAVYEHLLPEERETVLPLVWQHLKPGGTMFIGQTPFRWFPVESHTTGLPLLNYLPDRAAYRIAKRYCARFSAEETWTDMLRRGIRGGTEGQIVRQLEATGGRAELLEPGRNGVRDRIDLWYGFSSAVRAPASKRLLRAVFKAVRATTGATVVPSLSLAIRRVE